MAKTAGSFKTKAEYEQLEETAAQEPARTPWNDGLAPVALTDDQEAPDPVEFAQIRSSAQEPPTIPALTDGAPTDVAHALVMIAQMLKEVRAGDAGSSVHLASIERLLAHQEATRPHENLFNPPLVSEANPLGERDHPRPELRCKMYWTGYEIKKESLSCTEIELLNRIKPGVYQVHKADGQRISFTVGEKRSDSGTIEQLTFHFPCKGAEHRQNHNSMTAYLQEALGETVTAEGLRAQIVALERQIATQQAAA